MVAGSPPTATVTSGSTSVIDIAHRLSAITAQLIVGALDDRWVDVRHSRELAERIPTARLVELPCGHVGPVSEVAAEVSTMIAAHAAGR